MSRVQFPITCNTCKYIVDISNLVFMGNEANYRKSLEREEKFKQESV